MLSYLELKLRLIGDVTQSMGDKQAGSTKRLSRPMHLEFGDTGHLLQRASGSSYSGQVVGIGSTSLSRSCCPLS